MDEYIPLILRYAYTATSYTTYLTTKVLSASAPLKGYLASASKSNPDLTNLALLLAVIYLSLAILGMATRYVYSTIMTMVKLVMLVVAVAVGLWVYNSGVGEVFSVLQSIAMGLMKESQKGARDGFGRGQQGDWGRPEGTFGRDRGYYA